MSWDKASCAQFVELHRYDIESGLEELIQSAPLEESLKDAIAYSVLGAGKRLRPLLALLCVQDLGGNPSALLRASLALELLHCSSLIHDDLPALDNDDFRRGKPACHRAWGEGTAILAGDTLVGLITRAIEHDSLSSWQKAGLYRIALESFAALCDGQQRDIQGPQSYQGLIEVHRKKTGALFSACTRFAGLIAEVSQEMIELLGVYGVELGVFFQHIDDFLDMVAEESVTGKLGQSDKRNQKWTLFSGPESEGGIFAADGGRTPGIEAIRESQQRLLHLRRKMSLQEKGSMDFPGLCYVESLMLDRCSNYLQQAENSLAPCA